VRRQRLNLEQSLLVAILRQHFVAWEQESGTGASQAQIAIDDLLLSSRFTLAIRAANQKNAPGCSPWWIN
jgi:hypothetical protein